MANTTKFEIYTDAKGHFRWKLLSKNGESVAVGGEGYSDKRGATNAVKKLKDWANTTVVTDTTVKKAEKKAPAKPAKVAKVTKPKK